MPGDYTGYPDIDGQDFDDIIISENIGDGEVILSNVTVNGNVYIYGGGSNSVYFKNSILKNVEIAKDLKAGDEFVRVVFLDGTTVDLVKTNSESAKIVFGEDSQIAKIEISASNVTIEVEDGVTLVTEPEVEVKADNAVINVPVSKITIDEAVENVVFNGSEIVSNEFIVKNEDELKLALTLEGKNIKLENDIVVTESFIINRPLVIYGNGKKLDGSGITSVNSNEKHAIIINSNNVVINNLEVINAKGFGIHIYRAKEVELNNIAVINSAKGGILINGSEVIINDVTLENNAWGGIEVSQGIGVNEIPQLTISGEVVFETDSYEPVIWIDRLTENNGWVIFDEDVFVHGPITEHPITNDEIYQYWFVPVGFTIEQ